MKFGGPGKKTTLGKVNKLCTYIFMIIISIK